MTAAVTFTWYVVAVPVALGLIAVFAYRDPIALRFVQWRNWRRVYTVSVLRPPSADTIESEIVKAPIPGHTLAGRFRPPAPRNYASPRNDPRVWPEVAALDDLEWGRQPRQ